MSNSFFTNKSATYPRYTCLDPDESRTFHKGKSFRCWEWEDNKSRVFINDEFYQDFVIYDGSLYMCATTTSTVPTESNDWVLVIKQINGKTFKPVIDSEGNLSWEIWDGVSLTPSVNITGPKGERGEKGDRGEKGETGEKGEKGEKGEPGENGVNAIISGALAIVDSNVGTPSVTVSMAGTESNRSFAFNFKNLKGEQGEKGEQGIQGPQGIPGERGEKGDQGERGEKGEKGDTGTSVTILGTKQNESELPTSGINGDGYIINGDLYVWDGSQWHNVGEIKGPKGEKGDKGDPGENGKDGQDGKDGKDNFSLGNGFPTIAGYKGKVYLDLDARVFYVYTTEWVVAGELSAGHSDWQDD